VPATVYARNIEPDASQALTITRQDGTVWATLSAATGNTVIGNMTTQFNSTVALVDDVPIVFGSSSDASMRWSDNQTNHALLLITNLGSAASSGNIIITAAANFNKDHDHTFVSNPTLIGHSATDPDTSNTQYWSLTHNTTDAVLTVGTGDLEISAAQVRAPSGGTTVLARADGTAWANIGPSTVGIGTLTRVSDDVGWEYGTSGDAQMRWSTGQATANSLLLGVGVGSLAQGGNIVIVNVANMGKDHDHAIATDPTLFIHSATDPDTANDEWISFTHDATDGLIQVGSGDIEFTVPGQNIKPATTNSIYLGHSSLAWVNVYTRALQPDTSQSLAINRQDGTAWATTSTGTAGTSIGIATRFNDNVNLVIGSSDDSFIDWSTAQATAHSLVWAIGVGSATQGGNLILTAAGNAAKDHDHATTRHS
jgi:hypothetical protein